MSVWVRDRCSAALVPLAAGVLDLVNVIASGIEYDGMRERVHGQTSVCLVLL